MKENEKQLQFFPRCVKLRAFVKWAYAKFCYTIGVDSIVIRKTFLVSFLLQYCIVLATVDIMCHIITPV